MAKASLFPFPTSSGPPRSHPPKLCLPTCCFTLLSTSVRYSKVLANKTRETGRLTVDPHLSFCSSKSHPQLWNRNSATVSLYSPRSPVDPTDLHLTSLTLLIVLFQPPLAFVTPGNTIKRGTDRSPANLHLSPPHFWRIPQIYLSWLASSNLLHFFFLFGCDFILFLGFEGFCWYICFFEKDLNVGWEGRGENIWRDLTERNIIKKYLNLKNVSNNR